MHTLKTFDKLEKQEKVDFFIKCQDLLIKHHPDSPFIFNKANVKERILYAQDILNKYKGFAYSDDNVCILYNYVKIEDIKNPIQTLKDHSYKSPRIDHNAISIDFVVFKNLKDCLPFCKANYKSHIQYVLFIKGGKPKVYKTMDFISRILNIPNV